MKRQTSSLALSIALLTLTAFACGGEDSPTPPAAGGGGDGGEAAQDAPASWGATCLEDAECEAPTDYCVKQPGNDEGYCTVRCPNLGADCTFEDWTCNIVGTCAQPMATWCGPPEEVENGGGVVVACE